MIFPKGRLWLRVWFRIMNHQPWDFNLDDWMILLPDPHHHGSGWEALGHTKLPCAMPQYAPRNSNLKEEHSSLVFNARKAIAASSNAKKHTKTKLGNRRITLMQGTNVKEFLKFNPLRTGLRCWADNKADCVRAIFSWHVTGYNSSHMWAMRCHKSLWTVKVGCWDDSIARFVSQRLFAWEGACSCQNAKPCSCSRNSSNA